jgi:hypothetical protein
VYKVQWIHAWPERDAARRGLGVGGGVLIERRRPLSPPPPLNREADIFKWGSFFRY